MGVWVWTPRCSENMVAWIWGPERLAVPPVKHCLAHLRPGSPCYYTDFSGFFLRICVYGEGAGDVP